MPTPLSLEERTEQLRASTFPMVLPHGCTANLVSRADYTAFFEQHAHAVFPGLLDHKLELPEERAQFVEALRASYQSRGHSEFLLFYNGDGEVIGWHNGSQEDTMTFYMRNTAVLPPFRSLGLYTAFLPQFLAYLRALGYERVSSSHKPDNTPVLVAKLKAGFVIAGITLDDCFGTLVRLICNLHADRAACFNQRFT